MEILTEAEFDKQCQETLTQHDLLQNVDGFDGVIKDLLRSPFQGMIGFIKLETF